MKAYADVNYFPNYEYRKKKVAKKVFNFGQYTDRKQFGNDNTYAKIPWRYDLDKYKNDGKSQIQRR